jgi:NAD(P)-dependent dehydrogenase (short-subunit alcohol dehydrogenase family)
MAERTALVTGASRGIGLEIARRLAREGYALTLTARRAPLLEQAKAQLPADADICLVAGDLAAESFIARLAQSHAERFGTLDLLVLNAGLGATGAVTDMPLKTYDLLLNVNLRAQFLLIQRMLPALRLAAERDPQLGARVVAIASITGVVAEAGLAAYGASKAGLISLCEALTLEESARGVSATAISPGYVDTDMTSWMHDTLAPSSMLRAADVAELVLAIARLSAAAVVPHIVVSRAGGRIWRA